MSGFSPDTEPTSAPETGSARGEWKQFLRDIVETLGLALILFLVINLISVRVSVEGFSMVPTLNDGQSVFISRLSYKLGEYHRGDIIVFRPPMYPEGNGWRLLLGMPDIDDDYEDYIKRVIGLPGDTVKMENRTVFINDVVLYEPYISASPEYSGEWQVPDGYLFVLGDNRNYSYDSHQWGLLPQENVLGKAIFIYWPFADWALIKSDYPVLASP